MTRVWVWLINIFPSFLSFFTYLWPSPLRLSPFSFTQKAPETSSFFPSTNGKMSAFLTARSSDDLQCCKGLGTVVQTEGESYIVIGILSTQMLWCLNAIASKVSLCRAISLKVHYTSTYTHTLASLIMLNIDYSMHYTGSSTSWAL